MGIFGTLLGNKVDPKEQKRRLDICKSCKYITPEFRCQKCGCYLKIKTNGEKEHCKIGKW